MKRNIIAIALLSLGAMPLVLSSCDEVEEQAFVVPTTASSLSLSQSAVVIDATTPEDNALTLSWTPADLGTSKAALQYTLLVRPANVSDEGQTQRIPLGVNTKSFSMTHLELNELATSKLKLAVGEVGKISLRLQASPLSNAISEPSSLISNVSEPVVLTVTPASLSLKSPSVYLVGNLFGSNDWNNSYTGFPLMLETADAKVYNFTGYIPTANAEFKFMPESSVGDWGGILGGSAGTIGGGSNISVGNATAGYYTISYDSEAATYAIAPYDATGKEVYNAIGLIGDAVGGWETDVLFRPHVVPHLWIAQNVTLSAGQFKIRANQAWAKSWTVGVFPLTNGNNVISADDAGSYDVVFNDLTGLAHFKKR